MNANRIVSPLLLSRIVLTPRLMTLAMLYAALPLNSFADATAPCNAGTGSGATECGVNSNTGTANFATAVGNDAQATTEGSLAVGENVDATGSTSTAVGTIADATGSQSTALGHNADATGNNSIAVGKNSQATMTDTIAIGVEADATQPSTTAVGKSALANANNSTAIGANSAASGADSTALGQTSSAAGSGSTALGAQATTTMENSTAVGGAAQATGGSSTAVGLTATATTGSTALGSVAVASGVTATAIGGSTVAAATGSTAVGQDADVDINSNDAIALGHDAKVVNAPGGIAIGSDLNADGTGATATANSAIAIGADASVTTEDSIAIGQFARAFGTDSVVLGDFANSFTNTQSVVIGSDAVLNPSSGSSTVIGYLASGTGANSIAIGRVARAFTNSLAIGTGSSAESFGSTSLGRSADIDMNSDQAIALGHNADVVNAPGGIAIGGDVDGNLTGATAIAPGAIAIGADVVADKANTMSVGVPIEIVRDDGSSNLLVEENNVTVAVRTLGELANNGGVRLRFNNMALGEEWDFTSNQSGGFQFSLVGSGGAELSVATNGTVRMGPGPISNLTLFPSGNMTIEGVLTENSDRESKQDIKALNLQAILDKVANLPIREWEYKDSPDQRHIGPMAQDFHEAFELGADNTHIATLDMAGVALASIQALQTENDNKDQRIEKLETRLSELESKLAMLIE